MNELQTAAQIAEQRDVGVILDHRGREIQQKYDVLEANRARRQPSIERKGEDSIYDQTRRLKGCSLGRDLERNYSPAKGLIHQFKMNVVGIYGKLQVNTDGGEEAAAWFNEVWAPDCDFRADLHFGDWLQNTVAGIIREGDQLSVFDDDLVEDSGKLLTWEADQIVPLSATAFRKSGYKKKDFSDRQDNGIIRDRWGREKAYVTTSKRGIRSIEKASDGTIYPRGLARLIRNPWRHNQGRGVPSFITTAANYLDMYEILSSYLQTVKRSAKQYGYVYRADAVTDYDDPGSGPEFLPENTGKTATSTDAENPNVETAPGAKSYEQFEAFLGGNMDYLDPQDRVEFPDDKHPNPALPPFMDSVHGFSGAALGIASAYTKLRAEKSYTAFRGDMIMTWVTFIYWQKWLERYVADWTARNAIAWGIRTGAGFKDPGKEWQRALAWTWPVMPEVDELDAEQAIAAGLANGTLDYAKLLGPDWEKKLESYAKQIDKIRALGLPLAILAGNYGTANPKKEQNRNGGTEE